MARRGFEGAAEMKAALANMETAMATRIGRKAVRTAAGLLRDGMREAAPHRPGVQLKVYTAKDGSVRRTDYGDLRDNIKVRSQRATKAGHIVYEVTTGRAFWGFFAEFGTSRQPARPWARPVVEGMGENLLTVMGSELRAGITQQVARAGRARRRATNLTGDE